MGDAAPFPIPHSSFSPKGGPASGRPIPSSYGYHMPAEWEEHSATWLAWPHNLDTWPTQLKQVEEIYLQMIEPLAAGEKVNVLVNGGVGQELVEKRLLGAGISQENVIFYHIDNFDAWMRDAGPIFVTRDNEMTPLAVTDWIFNAWGNKYTPWPHDNDISRKITDYIKIPRFEAGIVLEGGSIDVNGFGTCLTTEQCLLNPNRNAKLSRNDIEQYLKNFLGTKKVVWLKRGIEGDDTDGHVDDIARFVGATKILCAVEEDPTDSNFAPLAENFKILQGMRDQFGRPLEIVKLPMPGPVFAGDGRRLPASYANFYIGNEVVLVPIYGHKNDELALKIISEQFPKRRAIGIRCEALIYGMGAIHCVTQQQPTIP